MKVSVAIMAHRKRAAFVAELKAQVPEATVVWDRYGDRWETGNRALQAYDADATHHVVIQDDAVVCKDFVAGVERLLDFVPDNPISLYTGRTRPFGQKVRDAVFETRRRGLKWLVLDNLYWGVGVVLPVPLLEEMVSFHQLANIKIANYDSKMSFYFAKEGHRVFYPQPSLVNHRDVAENPSLVPGRHAAGRVAHRFIGTRSPVKVRWNTQALYLDEHGNYHIGARDSDFPRPLMTVIESPQGSGNLLKVRTQDLLEERAHA